MRSRFQRLLPIVRRSLFGLCAFACVFGASRAQASIIDVDIQGFSFNGMHLTISLGDTVRWRNLDTTTHTTTEGTDAILQGTEAWHHSFPSSSTNPAAFEVTFDAAFLAANPRAGNRYDYLCIPHNTFMRGSVTVDTGPGVLGCFCFPAPPCAGVNSDAGAGCPNAAVVFRGARMMGSGTSSVSADDLSLQIDNLPPLTQSILLRSEGNMAKAPFLDGWLCVSSPFLRVRTVTTSVAGTVTYGPGLVTSSLSSWAPLAPGHYWTYQLWYREAPSIGGGNCGNGANYSNTYEVAFTP